MDLRNNTETLQTFHPEPRLRGTIGLLLSCFLTLILCIWSSIHPNVPGTSRRWYGRIGIKTSWMVMALLAPEMVLFMAYKQYTAARNLTYQFSPKSTTADPEYDSPFPMIVRGWRNTRDFIGNIWARLKDAFGKKSSRSCSCTSCREVDIAEGTQSFSGWTISHGFLLAMGGLAFSTYDESGAKFISKHELLRITVTGARCIMATADKDLLPGISKKMIEDKSKANRFVKFLVILQTAIFAVQCIARLVQRLGITPIELNTSMHVICAIIMNGLWWYKPFDVQIPVVISGERAARLAALLYTIEVNYRRNGDQNREETFAALEDSLVGSYFPLPSERVQATPVIIHHSDAEVNWTSTELATIENSTQSNTSDLGTPRRQVIEPGISQVSGCRPRIGLQYLDDHDCSSVRHDVPPMRRKFSSHDGNLRRDRDHWPINISIPEESEITPPPRYSRPFGLHTVPADSADPDTISPTQTPRRASVKNTLASPTPSTITLVGSDRPNIGETISSVLCADSQSEKPSRKRKTELHAASEDCPRAQELRRELTVKALRQYDQATKQSLRNILREGDEGPVVENEVKDIEVFSFLKATYRDKKERWMLFYHPVFGLFTALYGAAHLIIIYCQKPPLLRTGFEIFLWKFSAGLITTTTGALYTFEFIVPFFFNPLGDLVTYSWKKLRIPLERLLKRLAHYDDPGRADTDHSRFIKWGLKRLQSWSVVDGPVTIQDYYTKLFKKLERKLTDSSWVTRFINTGLVLFLVTVFALCRSYLIFECLYTIPNLPDKFYERPTFGGLPFL